MLMMIFLISGCSSIKFENQRNNQATGQESTPQNLFNVSGQIINDELIRSVQLFRNKNPDSPPAIELHSRDKLQLHFDYLDVSSKQFVVTFSHHNIDWSLSPLPTGNFLQGIHRFYLDAGSFKSSSRPVYRSYSAAFPNDQMMFLKSGNYMMRVEDADTGFVVMTLPFFIFENKGSLTSSVEFIQSPRQNLRSVHRPVNQYIIPDAIEQPQFNLAFRITQNRFWGRTTKPAETDFSNPGSVLFEVNQDQAFIADYFFYPLFVNDISLENRRIIDYFPEEIPPRILLRDDTANLASLYDSTLPASSFGLPNLNENAEYVNIIFSLDTDNSPDTDESVYLVGDFTGWAIKSENRLTYNIDTNRWQTSSIMKEGLYKYKYVRVANNKLDDLFYDPTFERTKQEYQVFVYLRDKNEFYDRLLQVNTLVAGS